MRLVLLARVHAPSKTLEQITPFFRAWAISGLRGESPIEEHPQLMGPGVVRRHQGRADQGVRCQAIREVVAVYPFLQAAWNKRILRHAAERVVVVQQLPDDDRQSEIVLLDAWRPGVRVRAGFRGPVARRCQGRPVDRGWGFDALLSRGTFV